MIKSNLLDNQVGWSGWFYQWNQTTFSHRNYRSRGRARATSGEGNPEEENFREVVVEGNGEHLNHK